MNLKTKKLVARELLYLFATIIICFSSFLIGLFIDDKKNDAHNEESLEIERIETKWKILLEEFRKDNRVDSLFKLQREFHGVYTESFGFEEIDRRNYFFWKNVRKSIHDKTFHFTYASDEIVDQFNSDLARILYLSNEELKSTEVPWTIKGKKEMFSDFALNNDYERFISKVDWKNYEDLREHHYSLSEKNKRSGFSNNYELFFLYALSFCLGLLFFMRYSAYLLMWIFRTLKETSKE